MRIKVGLTDIEELADSILGDVDYDIFKEDLEERIILSDIEGRIVSFLEELGVSVVEDFDGEED